MTEQQAEQIIELLQAILRELEDIKKDTDFISGRVA
jgi:hypothetical protein